MKVSLHFERTYEGVTLEKMHFHHPLLGESIHSQRASRIKENLKSFSWSAAIKAMCCFFLKAKIAGPFEVVLQGGPGTLAASFDYALAKQPNWLTEMFGTDSNGDSLLRRIIVRENPELKRTGPVKLALRNALQIDVLLDSSKIENESDLVTIISAIAEEKHSNHKSVFSADKLSLAEREVWASLNTIDPLNSKYKSDLLYSVVNSPRLNNLVSRKNLNNFSDHIISNIVEREIKPIERQIKFWITPWELPSTTVLRNTRLPIDFDFSHHYSIRILADLESAKSNLLPEFTILGLGAVASVLKNSKRSNYKPILLMPPVSASLHMNRNWFRNHKKPGGKIVFHSQDFCSSGLMVNDLFSARVLKKENFSELLNFDYNKSLAARWTEDESAVLFGNYPHKFFNLNQYSDVDQIYSGWMPTVLMCRKDVEAKIVETVSSEILSSWRELSQSRGKLRRSVAVSFNDSTYCSNLQAL